MIEQFSGVAAGVLAERRSAEDRSAALSRADQHAAAAAERYGELSAEGARFVTTNYIVDETATRLCWRRP